MTKYVTEAFGLLLLTDSFNCTESLPVRTPLGLSSQLSTLGRAFPFAKLGNHDIIFLFMSKEDTKLRESEEEKKIMRGSK